MKTTAWNKIKAEYLQGVTPKELAEKYQIYEFLRTKPFDKHTPIYFYSSGELVGKVSGRMKGYNPGNSLPVVAVIEVTSKEDKKYALLQVIQYSQK